MGKGALVLEEKGIKYLSIEYDSDSAEKLAPSIEDILLQTKGRQ